MTKPLFIFDLDGTLALTDHRQHHLEATPPNWGAFFADCHMDGANAPAIATMGLLIGAGAEVYIFSGRSDEVEEKTLRWLIEHTPFGSFAHASRIQMRPSGDYTPDEVLKRQWYEAMTQADKDRLIAVFDDRDKVVAMWRSLGVACFQVAPGGF